MSGEESVFQNLVEGMLYAGQTLGRVVVLVVYVDIAVLYGLFHVFGQQAFVYERLRGFGCELHHHACRSVCIHVRVLPGDVGSLGFDDFLEDFAGLGFSGEIPLVTVCDVFLGHFFSRTVHQLHFHMILDVLHAHAFGSDLRDGGCDFGSEHNIFTLFRDVHRLQYGINDFPLVKLDNTPVTLYHKFYHNQRCLNNY